MFKYLQDFFRCRATKYVLRFAYVFCFVAPILWWAEEVVYLDNYKMQRIPHEGNISWYQISDPTSFTKKDWCILTMNPINIETAIGIGVNKKLVTEKAVFVRDGEGQVGLRDKKGCSGIDADHMYWILFDKTQKEHTAHYLKSEVSIWVKRLIFAIITIFAGLNIFVSWVRIFLKRKFR